MISFLVVARTACGLAPLDHLLQVQDASREEHLMADDDDDDADDDDGVFYCTRSPLLLAQGLRLVTADTNALRPRSE